MQQFCTYGSVRGASGNRFEDLVSGFSPGERFRIPAVMVEKSSNRVLEFAGAAVNAAAQSPFIRSANQRSTRLSQEPPVGVKCR